MKSIIFSEGGKEVCPVKVRETIINGTNGMLQCTLELNLGKPQGRIRNLFARRGNIQYPQDWDIKIHGNRTFLKDLAKEEGYILVEDGFKRINMKKLKREQSEQYSLILSSQHNLNFEDYLTISKLAEPRRKGAILEWPIAVRLIKGLIPGEYYEFLQIPIALRIPFHLVIKDCIPQDILWKLRYIERHFDKVRGTFRLRKELREHYNIYPDDLRATMNRFVSFLGKKFRENEEIVQITEPDHRGQRPVITGITLASKYFLEQKVLSIIDLEPEIQVTLTLDNRIQATRHFFLSLNEKALKDLSNQYFRAKNKPSNKNVTH